jgi:RNA-directed DNA polymerase
MSTKQTNQNELAQHVALWDLVKQAGGPRRYVEQQLRQQGVFVRRQDVLSMGFSEKKAYTEKVAAEDAVRKPLQSKVWASYTALHIVHLGEEIFWANEIAYDTFDSAHLEQRLKQHHLPKLDSVADLCQALKISLRELRWLCYHREAAQSTHYRAFEIPKKTGGMRKIWAPLPRLKATQHWILHNIAERFSIHGAAHGFVAGRSIYSNALAHVDSQIVVSMDLKDFFPSFTFKRVKGIFRRNGYFDGMATILALLCTEAPREVTELEGKTYYIAMGPRCLPQGSPVSPALTNAACLRLDRRLAGWADKHGWRYTRYADDLTFSLPSGAEEWIHIPQVKDVSEDQEAVDQEAVDQAEMTVDQAEMTVDQAEMTVDQAEMTVDQAEMTVDQAEMTVDQLAKRSRISHLLGTVHQIVEDEGLEVRVDKTHIMRKGAQQKVTGLVVNGQQNPRPLRSLKRQVRAMLHNVRTGKGLHEGDSINRLTGYIAYIYMCDPVHGKKLLKQLKSLTP